MYRHAGVFETWTIQTAIRANGQATKSLLTTNKDMIATIPVSLCKAS